MFRAPAIHIKLLIANCELYHITCFLPFFSFNGSHPMCTEILFFMMFGYKEMKYLNVVGNISMMNNFSWIIWRVRNWHYRLRQDRNEFSMDFYLCYFVPFGYDRISFINLQKLRRGNCRPLTLSDLESEVNQFRGFLHRFAFPYLLSVFWQIFSLTTHRFQRRTFIVS